MKQVWTQPPSLPLQRSSDGPQWPLGYLSSGTWPALQPSGSASGSSSSSQTGTSSGPRPSLPGRPSKLEELNGRLRRYLDPADSYDGPTLDHDLVTEADMRTTKIRIAATVLLAILSIGLIALLIYAIPVTISSTEVAQASSLVGAAGVW